MKLRDMQDLVDMLTWLDDLTYNLSEPGTMGPEGRIFQNFLAGLSEKYHLEKRVVARETLECKRLIAIIRARYRKMSEVQSVHGDALVNKPRTEKKSNGNHSSGDKSKETSKIICYRCKRPGHIETSCPLKKLCAVFGGRVHTAGQCGTDSNTLAVFG